MIAVIADDFTGAAELAGICLRYGLTVEVCLENVTGTEAEVLIISTDSRSMQKAAAIYCTADVVEAVLKYQPALLYKKIDSVLRGYVLDEAKVQMELCEQSKAFILPANPSLHRTIKEGEYFIGNEKITATGFVNDPEFPVQSASITGMLHDETIVVLKHDDWLPLEGIVVGEAVTNEDVTAWANAIDTSWMLAGAGDFFNALLQKQYEPKQQPEATLQSPHLYVCGTAYAERKAFVKELHDKTGLVAYLPETVTAEWIDEAGKQLGQQKKLLLAIDEPKADALALRTAMAAAVKQIVENEKVQEIFIEGGSTAAAILQELQITTLIPVNELQRGVVRMKAGGLFITVKPGSYPLSNEIIQLYS
ncbi:four-carbon acid sugar kinase family protein [Ferruginibacter sp.]